MTIDDTPERWAVCSTSWDVTPAGLSRSSRYLSLERAVRPARILLSSKGRPARVAGSRTASAPVLRRGGLRPRWHGHIHAGRGSRSTGPGLCVIPRGCSHGFGSRSADVAGILPVATPGVIGLVEELFRLERAGQAGAQAGLDHAAFVLERSRPFMPG